MVGSDSVCWHPGVAAQSPRNQHPNRSTTPSVGGDVPTSTWENEVSVDVKHGTARMPQEKESNANEERAGIECKHDWRRSVAGMRP
jgi:hypothetical protein